MTSKTISFWTPVIPQLNDPKRERFSSLGRFQENIWNVQGCSKKVARIHTISDQKVLMNPPEKNYMRENCVKTALKIAALILAFPIFLIFRVIYRKLNHFVVNENIKASQTNANVPEVSQNKNEVKETKKSVEVKSSPIALQPPLSPDENSVPEEIVPAQKMIPEISANKEPIQNGVPEENAAAQKMIPELAIPTSKNESTQKGSVWDLWDQHEKDLVIIAQHCIPAKGNLKNNLNSQLILQLPVDSYVEQDDKKIQYRFIWDYVDPGLDFHIDVSQQPDKYVKISCYYSLAGRKEIPEIKKEWRLPLTIEEKPYAVGDSGIVENLQFEISLIPKTA